ncbi:hypothetical protein D3C76_1417060 [compost metagenome]
MAVGANPQATALGQVVHRREDAVAEVGFGGQAQAGDCATAGHQLDFIGLGMGGVDQAPALVDFGVFVQPLQRTAAAPGQAVVDFLLLLGDMDMHRAGLVAGGHNLGDLLRGDRAQGVEAQAQRLRRLPGQLRREA